ncbi:C40 family peptidase [Alkalihalobacillus deserti]|uniref:C40 family peptidase n=1 Tax=Alkalihalobacillus deserti TaxID=2879466 RepID=UPI001D132F52|nr:peptidoglycan-binding protein [Alkalihalobacillus deserti]
MKEASTLKKVVLSSTFATGLMLATPLAADAALGDQTLRIGMDDPDVKDLQDTLKNKGFFTHPSSTGYYGSITADAVRQFQAKHNLQVDGIAGPQTLRVLLKKMDGQAHTASAKTVTAQSSSQVVQSTTLLRSGSSGTQVEQLQQKLKERGHYNYTITGQFGRITEAAVKEYQRANNLVVDGIVGPQTLGLLINEPTTAQAPTYQTETRDEKIASRTVVNTTPSASTQTISVLKIGSSGTAVTGLQVKLRSLGLFDQEPTGYYGEVTAAAVRSLQRLHQLTADGIAGPKTLNTLNSLATNQPAAQAPSIQPVATTPAQQAPTQPTASPAALVTNLVAEAANYIGVPYLWGGTSTAGFDCSGLIQYVFNKQGISIPRTVAQQWNAGKTVAQPAVGDLVFFETISAGPSHNGIYIGNNQFVHSGSSTGVTIANMNSSYWSERYLGAKRLY